MDRRHSARHERRRRWDRMVPALQAEIGRRGLGQGEAARQMGVNPGSLSRWINGETGPGDEAMDQIYEWMQ